jgi:hypothetical protein
MRHRGCFAHDLTCVRPKWMRKPLTDQAVAIEGRDSKTLSGNDCVIYFSWAIKLASSYVKKSALIMASATPFCFCTM